MQKDRIEAQNSQNSQRIEFLLKFIAGWQNLTARLDLYFLENAHRYFLLINKIIHENVSLENYINKLNFSLINEMNK